MLERMREIARQNPDNIRIIETSVDSELQIEFFETLQNINDNEEGFEIEILKAELISDETILEKT
jgi:hypothetical protein